MNHGTIYIADSFVSGNYGGGNSEIWPNNNCYLLGSGNVIKSSSIYGTCISKNAPPPSPLEPSSPPPSPPTSLLSQNPVTVTTFSGLLSAVNTGKTLIRISSNINFVSTITLPFSTVIFGDCVPRSTCYLDGGDSVYSALCCQPWSHGNNVVIDVNKF